MDPRSRRGIVTPEAVLLEFETATVGSRSLALAIDMAAQFGAFLVAAMALGVLAPLGLDEGDWVVAVYFTILGFLIVFGYPVWMESRYGRTLGKMALGLRVVTTEGAPIRFRHAAIRAALSLVDLWLVPIGVVGTVATLLNRQNQRLGDMAAGTVVLRERSGAFASVAVAFPPPPGYETYAAGLDVAAVTPEQYGLVRSFLVRVFTFSPAARMALGLRLAQPLAQRMRHTPPSGLGPELFLVCVAAAYQRRHGGPAVPLPPWTRPSSWSQPAGAPPAYPPPVHPPPPPPPVPRPGYYAPYGPQTPPPPPPPPRRR